MYIHVQAHVHSGGPCVLLHAANSYVAHCTECVHVCVLIICRAYHGHSKPLMGLSSYKMKQEKDGHSRIAVNPNAWIVSVCVCMAISTTTNRSHGECVHNMIQTSFQSWTFMSCVWHTIINPRCAVLVLCVCLLQL